MNFYYLLFALHAFMLWRENRRIAATLFDSAFAVPLAVVMLSWANLIHTSVVLSTVGLLGNPIVFFLMSFGMARLTGKAMRFFKPGETPSDEIVLQDVLRRIRQDAFARRLSILTGVVILFVILIGISVLPNNWDSLAYRFPRAYFYLSSGALDHPGTGIDSRILFYPYNGSILYLFLAQYHLTGVAFNFVGIGAWLMVAFATFYYPLLMGASVRAAVAAAFLTSTTPVVLCVANSTNDELIGGAPLLVGFLFLVLWYKLRSAGALFLALVTLSICLAVKNHWLFLSGFVAFAAILALTRFRKPLTEAVRETIGIRHAAVAALFCLPLLVSYLVTNYAASGKLTDEEYTTSIINIPFNTVGALQNTKLYTAQMLLTPIVDHAFALGLDKARLAMRWANEVTNTALMKGIRQGFPFTHRYYTFRGLYPPDGEVYFEQTLWVGLMPYLSLICLAWFLMTRPSGSPVSWVVLGVFPLWHLVFCALHRYGETMSVYYAYVSPLAFVSLTIAWEGMQKSESLIWRRLAMAFPIVICSNAVLAGVLFFGSQKRDVSLAWTSRDGETTVSRTNGTLRNVIENAEKVYIPYSHWEQLYWNIMRLNPAARYYTAEFRPQENYDLIVKSYSGSYAWDSYVPIQATHFGELKWIGVTSGGEAVLLCSGKTCMESCTDCDDFFTLSMRQERKDNKLTLVVTGLPDGLPASSPGAVRFVFFHAAMRTSTASDWVPVAKLPNFRFEVPEKEYDHVQVEVSCEPGPSCPVSQTTFPLRINARPLVDPQPEFSSSLDPAAITTLFGPGWEGTEGSGYWKFDWKLRPGTNIMDAVFKGGGGEVVTDEIAVQSVSRDEVVFRRKGTSGNYRGSWLPSRTPSARGIAEWNKTNYWFGRRKGAGTGTSNTVWP